MMKMDLSLLGMKQIEKGMMVAEEGEEVEEDHSEDAVVDLEEASEVEVEDLEEVLEAVEEGLEDAVDLEAEVAEDSEEEEVEEAERAVLKQQNWKKQHHIKYFFTIYIGKFVVFHQLVPTFNRS